MKYNLILLPFLFLFIISCGNQPTVNSAEDNNEPIQYDSLDINILKSIYTKIDAIDVTFNDLPISMSMDTPESSRKFFTYFSTEAATLLPSCKPMGQILMKGKGEVLAEFNIYLQDNCLAFTYLKDRKEIAANKISKVGLDFFGKTLMNVKVGK